MNTETQLDRLKATGRTQPFTPVETAFFSRPDHMVKPDSESRAPINISPRVRERLRKVLLHDERFRGIGYTEFIDRTLDILDCED